LAQDQIQKSENKQHAKSESEIRKNLADSDMVFITCDLAAEPELVQLPYCRDWPEKSGALTIGVVTHPFTVEGQKRLENAQYGLERMLQLQTL
jgi:cell division protein FtsZ